MKQKLLILAACVLALSAGVFALNNTAQLATHNTALGMNDGTDSAPPAGKNSLNSLPARQQEVSPEHAAKAQGQGADIPEGVVYGILFRQLTALKRAAVKLERQGKDGSALRGHLKKKAKLTDERAEMLDRIALETEREVTQIDKEARKIIDGIRVLHPKGMLKDGEPLPLPPPELTALKEQRNNIILQARERLRLELGDAEFQRFDALIKEDMARRIKKLESEPTVLRSANSTQGQK